MLTAPRTPPSGSRPRLLLGGVRVFLAESLLIPTGLLTAAYLARRLGPDGYGIFVVAAALVGWIEWGLVALLSRTSVRFVADAEDWRPVGATLVSAQAALASIAALLLVVLAGPIAGALDTPALAGRLQLFAVDIPLFCLAQAHRNILVGLGDFSERALAAAARWLSRLVLVVVFVELGLSIDGAILGSVGASLIELAVCRRFVRPGFSLSALLRLRTLWSYAAPLLLSALALRLFDKLDLITLTALGGTPEQAGRYGAAQNLAILPSLFALSFSQLLLSSLTRAYRDGADAGPIARNAMRGVLLLVPFVALAAGAAPEIVRLVFGPAFAAAAPLLAPLLFAGVALVMGSVASSVLIAAGRPGLTLALTGPLPVVAAIGYLVVIPRAGPEGASLVTFAAATLSAIALVLAVRRWCRVLPPAAPLLQSGIVSAAVYAAAVLWPAGGMLVVLKLAVVGVGIVIAFLLTGAIRPAELTAASSWWRRDAGR